MASTEREFSRDSQRRLSHKSSSSSDQGKALIPMWDSSDPERAPPPLPLNPGSPIATSHRPAPSSAIASAHAALTEKARENSYGSSPTKRIESSERALMRASTHKRMQSLGNSSVREISNLLEGGSLLPAPKMMPKDAGSSTPGKVNRNSWVEPKSPEKSSSRPSTPTSTPTVSETPVSKSSQRKPPQSILGENTPPQSATMLALQNMPNRDAEKPLTNLTNGAMVRSPQSMPVPGPQQFPSIDDISSQIFTLTGIAQSLQREMFNLSRRSKDNATDLLSLKEATNTRDEDIRRALKDLMAEVSESSRQSTHSLYGSSQPLLLDNKPHNSSPGSVRSKAFTLPRIPSPSSFAASIERESLATPAAPIADNSAAVSMLEKIIDEMGTKKGQEDVIDRLSDVSSKLAAEGVATAKKLEELLQAVKAGGGTDALVARDEAGDNINRTRHFSFDDSPSLDLDFDRQRMGPMVNRVEHLLANTKAERRASDSSRSDIGDEAVRSIKALKDSVSQSGGLTAEVKALVRELRGEVLGMGRELGRKMDEAAKDNAEFSEDGKVERARLEHIAMQSLEEIKGHLEQVIKEYSRQTSAAILSRSSVDMPEVYNAVKAAITEMHARTPIPRKDDIVHAVKEAWEKSKPNVEVQHFGLEREELLGCLQQGMREYSQQYAPRYPTGATREEVFKAVVEGLKHFKLPPPVIAEPPMSRDEILNAVRECLEEFEFPVAPSTLSEREFEISRDDMVEAVKEALTEFEFPDPSQDLVDKQISKDDVLDAVKQGLESFEFQIPDVAKELADKTITKLDVLQAVKECLDNFEFPIPDTSQALVERGIGRDDLLEAVREGLAGFEFPSSDTSRDLVERSLTRDDIFEVVQRCIEVHMPSPVGISDEQILARLDQAVAAIKEEFTAVSEEAKQNVAAHGRDTEQLLDATKDGFDKLRMDIEAYVDRAAELGGNDDTIDMIKREFSRLHEGMANTIVPAGLGISDKEDILLAIREGLDSLRGEIERPRDGNESILSGTSEILDALYDGLNGLKADVEKINDKPVDQTVSYEILDTLKAGLEGIRNDIDQLRNKDKEESIQEAVPNYEGAIIPVTDSLNRNDIEHLETLITQVQIKVESMESSTSPEPDVNSLSKEDLGSLEDLIRNLQTSIAELAAKDREAPEVPEFPVKREDFEALETLLCNTKAKIDEMEPEQAAKKEHVDALELLIRETRDTINEIKAQSDQSAHQEELTNVETLVKEVLVAIADIKENTSPKEDEENITKTDVQAVEALCHEMKAHLDKIAMTDLALLSSKEDLNGLEGLVKEFKDRIEIHAETNSKSFEERQAEIVGISERITEVKTFMDEFKEAVHTKLADGSTNLEMLSKALDDVSEKVNKNETVSDDVKELVELVKVEFEKTNTGVVGAKLETDEKFEKTWNKLDDKVDERFNELMIKYTEAQLSYEAKNEATEKRELEMEAAVLNSKALSEELKLLVDTLGSTLTESVEKMDEASKTVFHRVDETFGKVEEMHNESKTSHESTKEHIDKSLSAIEELRGTVSDNQPKILDAIKEVLEIVGQHYEHAKSSSDSLSEKISEIPAAIPPLLPEPPAPTPEKDDTPIHDKLDKLVAHIDVAGKSFEQLEILGKIYAQMTATSSEVSEFISAQTKLIKENDEDKERAAAEAAVALEQRTAQRNLVEAEIIGLREEEVALKESIARLKEEKEKTLAAARTENEQLKAEMLADKEHMKEEMLAEKERMKEEMLTEREQMKEEMLAEKERMRDELLTEKHEMKAEMLVERDELRALMREERNLMIKELKEEQDQITRQKMRMAADVSSLETALHIRREELHAMESRTEALERRILDSVIDHSRALLVNKGSRGREAMNLKRVPSQASSIAPSTLSANTSRNRSSLGQQSALGAAMTRSPTKAVPQANTARRILSLNEITHNVPTGGSVTSNFKRSHSVRNPIGPRKSSWGGSLRKDYGQLNKENLELALRETEEESDVNDVDGDNPDDVSDTATLRRTSLGTTVMTSTESYIDGGSTDYSTDFDYELGTDLSTEISTNLGSDLSTNYPESEFEVTVAEDDSNQMVLYDDGGRNDIAEVA